MSNKYAYAVGDQVVYRYGWRPRTLGVIDADGAVNHLEAEFCVSPNDVGTVLSSRSTVYSYPRAGNVRVNEYELMFVSGKRGWLDEDRLISADPASK